MNSKSKFFFKYIKSQLFTYLAYLIVFAVFFAVSFLYSLSAEPVAYASIISLISIIIIETVKFLRCLKRHNTLKIIKKEIIYTIDNLPSPESVTEEDYQDILKILNDCKNTIVSENDTKVSEMKDYYAMWAHQIKTPIAAMNLLLQCDESELNENLMSQLFRIEQYVDMVMQYLRADSISGDIVVDLCSLDEIVKSAVRKYRKLFIKKKINLNLEDIDCEVLTDEKWLQFVIEQLISNSLKYTNEGSLSIYMDKEMPKTLVIEDTGIGIREEDLPRIFESGFTGYNGRSDKKSTGIGLYLCRKILKKLHHSITVDSEIDKGTTVKIRLDREKRTYE